MAYAPRMDVCEKDDTLVFKAELPGLKKEDVQVEIHDGALMIKGESKAETEVKEEAYYCTERTFGSFYRSPPLPWEVTTLEFVILQPTVTVPLLSDVTVPLLLMAGE